MAVFADDQRGWACDPRSVRNGHCLKMAFKIALPARQALMVSRLVAWPDTAARQRLCIRQQGASEAERNSSVTEQRAKRSPI